MRILPTHRWQAWSAWTQAVTVGQGLQIQLVVVRNNTEFGFKGNQLVLRDVQKKLEGAGYKVSLTTIRGKLQPASGSRLHMETVNDPALVRRLAELGVVGGTRATQVTVASCAAFAAAFNKGNSVLATAFRSLSTAFDGGNVSSPNPGPPSGGPDASPSASRDPSPGRCSDYSDTSAGAFPSSRTRPNAGPGPDGREGRKVLQDSGGGERGKQKSSAPFNTAGAAGGSAGAGTSQPCPHFYPVKAGFKTSLQPKDLPAGTAVRTFGLLDKRSVLNSRVPYTREQGHFKNWCTSATELTRPPEMQALAATSWRSMEGAVSLFLGYCHVHLRVPQEFLGLTLFSNQVRMYDAYAWQRLKGLVGCECDNVQVHSSRGLERCVLR